MALTTTPTCGGDFPDVIVKHTDLAQDAAIDVFDGAKSVHAISINNTQNANVSYFKAYNAGAVDPASNVPNLKIAVPASVTLDIVIADGLSFTTAFSMRCVTGTTDTDNTAPTADVIAIVTGS
jgi:hypothetical protein